MRDPRSGQRGARGWCEARPGAASCREQFGPDRNGGGSPRPPESPSRARGGGGVQERRWPHGPRPRCPRRRRWGPELPPSQDRRRLLRAAPEAWGRDAAPRGRPRACSEPRVGAHGSGRARGGGVRFGTEGSRDLLPPPLPPRTAVPSRAALRSRTAGRRRGSTRESAQGARWRPARAPGVGTAAGGGRRAARRRGDYFPRPPAPRPLSSRGGTLRAAPAAAGYSDSCATYKRSLCGAILSLSVCGRRVIPAPRAESEGRRRRRKV